MASSIVTCDENMQKVPENTLCFTTNDVVNFMEKLKKQLAWTDVGKEVGVENGMLYLSYVFLQTGIHL